VEATQVTLSGVKNRIAETAGWLGIQKQNKKLLSKQSVELC
jgi:hypothetical protein